MQQVPEIFQTPAQVRINCLQRLHAVAVRVENIPVELKYNLFEQSRRTRDAYSQFRNEPNPINSVSFLQASLDLVRSFGPINPLCEEIFDLQVLIKQNDEILQGNTDYQQISTRLSALLSACDGFYSNLPIGMLDELYHFVDRDPEFRGQLDDLLAQETEELQQWWAIWNRSDSNFNEALQFAVNATPQNYGQLNP
jgi:hypothetical protein